MNRLQRIVFLAALLVATLGVVPARAQVDFSGEWAPRFWEDQPERVPGPELGNYLGIPINHLIEVSFENFPKLINALGGVNIKLDSKVCSEISGGVRNGGQSLRLMYSRKPSGMAPVALRADAKSPGTSNAPLKGGPVKNFDPVTITI